ncbi:late embryogenesis abundant protein [Striga asiatica]|uniref:Late embryogenesis abundant protein n=1 Tax=Striga asiatica TaxID=4170 RepID=A0A5A7P224_STRAF|nr:late embryogenesis abundant protein [Striga asiatica]
MYEKKEQVKPLAPVAAANHLEIESNAALPPEFMTRRRQTCIKFTGCLFAVLSVIVTILLVLTFTVFHVKDPILNIDYKNSNIRTLDRGLNATVEADISIRNPNVALFKFSNMTTIVYYGETIIGQTEAMFGEVGARRTLRMNVSIELRLLEVDLSFGILSISSYTRVVGRVKIGGGNKRSLVVRMNCTMNLNVSSHRVEELSCRRRVSL